jgi:hypothetical protein
MDELSRPPFQRHPTCIRDPVALAADRLAASLDSLVPRIGKTCADEASDCVAIDPVHEYKRSLGHDTRALQAWLGHRNIQHTVRYTKLAPDRFKDFWRE